MQWETLHPEYALSGGNSYSYLASGMSHEEVLEDFPYLEKEDILEALAFAAAAMDGRYIPLRASR